MNELEVAPNIPPDWRDWINEFPTIKSLAIFCFVGWIITPMEMSVLGWLIGSSFITGKEAIDAVLALVDKWLDALNILTFAAVFGVAAKYGLTKPDVIRAEGEVKAKTIVAAAQADVVKATGTFAVPQPVGVPHPGTDPAIVAALESVAAKQRSEEAILAQEAEARKQKHALAPPNGLEE